LKPLLFENLKMQSCARLVSLKPHTKLSAFSSHGCNSTSKRLCHLNFANRQAKKINQEKTLLSIFAPRKRRKREGGGPT
jgi:hypothetical protein